MNDETKAARIYLKTPEQKWLLRGGLAACALPFSIAIILAGLSSNKTAAVFFFLLVMCIIVGMIIAIILGTREIKNKNKHGFLGKSSIVWIALKAGFFAHWAVAGALFLYVFLVGSFGIGMSILIKAVVIGGFYTFVFWGFITLPVSIFCGLVFWGVAVRGSRNMMADVFD